MYCDRGATVSSAASCQARHHASGSSEALATPADRMKPSVEGIGQALHPRMRLDPRCWAWPAG